MESRLRFLGTGSSLGIPVLGCKCAICLSSDSKNKRMRSGALLQVEGKTFLIDVGPDYKEQALKNNIDSLDGLILTHSHYDHMGGFDDLRAYSYLGKKLPCLMLKTTFKELKTSCFYLIKPSLENPDYSPFFSWHLLQETHGKVVFEELQMEYVSFFQMGMQVMGLKIGKFAYISDIKEYGPDVVAQLEGTETLVLSALRKTPSPMHFSVDEALAFIALIKPQRTYLTHIAHEIDHETLLKELPPSVLIAYDGLEICW